MTQEHSIAPPSEDHILKWSDEWFEAKVKHMTREKHLCMQAARWGADQELEACCEWFVRDWTDIETADKLRAARRPKPPSLKEQALQVLANADGADHPVVATVLTADQHALIRKALEQLDD